MQTENSQAEIKKFTADTVKKAAGKMKPHKMDILQGFTSDCLLPTPHILFQLLALVSQDWLSHGTVKRSLLFCAFIPLIKGQKDPGKSDSYRATARSSHLLKQF